MLVIGVRAFRQNVEDQTVTMFGLALPDSVRGVGHCHVGSAGDFSAQGWGVSVSHAVTKGSRASVDYTQSTTQWSGNSRDAQTLAALAPATLRDNERVRHDGDLRQRRRAVRDAGLRRVQVNNTFARGHDTVSSALRNARFNVQVNQSLPFLSFANASWEMLAAVSNLFGDDAFDGSVYDESLVMQPPKRILGGVTVRF